MTRKRFVRLLMARGLTRNYANSFAIICRETGWSYETFYEGYILGPKDFRGLVFFG